jgi:hypothetical protein
VAGVRPRLVLEEQEVFRSPTSCCKILNEWPKSVSEACKSFLVLGFARAEIVLSMRVPA